MSLLSSEQYWAPTEVLLSLTPRGYSPPPWNPRTPWVHFPDSMWSSRTKEEMNGRHWSLVGGCAHSPDNWPQDSCSFHQTWPQSGGCSIWRELQGRCHTTCPQWPCIPRSGAIIQKSLCGPQLYRPFDIHSPEARNMKDLVPRSPSACFHSYLIHLSFACPGSTELPTGHHLYAAARQQKLTLS